MTTYYTTDQVAEKMGLTRQGINNNIRRGNLKAEKRNQAGVYRYMVSAPELRRFQAWWHEKRPDNNRWYKTLPATDETTEFGSTIYWSQVRIEPDPNTPNFSVRYVPVLCRCGLLRDLPATSITQRKYRGLCMPCSAVYYINRGAKHSDWKGGLWINEHGYRFIHVNALTGRDQELARAMITKSRPYVAEHRLVVARRLDRPLLRDELVHHRDADKQNNSDENLELVSPSGHAVVELVRARAEVKRLRALVALLLATGLAKGG